MVRPPTPLGPVGLILPTVPQTTTPTWARVSSGGSTSGATDPWASADGNGLPFDQLRYVCSEAEALGVGALWACDHIFWHRPVLECMTALTVAATATRRVALGSAVIQLPLRQPTIVAKEAASLQLASGGRFILGVGVGSHEGEYAQVGADYHRRGHDLDQGIDELRRSWASGAGVDAGDVAAGGPARYRQLPHPSTVPIWVGGSSEAALRRAAARADGWIPLFVPEAEYASAVDRLRKETDRAGRPADAVVPSIVLFVSVDPDGDKASRRGTAWMSSLYGIPSKVFARHLVSGPAEHVAARVDAYRQVGARHVVLYVTEDDPLPQLRSLLPFLPPDERAALPREV